MNDSVVGRIAGFARFLRENEIPVNPASVMDAQRIASLGYLGKSGLLKDGYRCCFCQCRDHWVRFDELFDSYWASLQIEDSSPDDIESDDRLTASVPGNERLLGFAGTSERDQAEAISGAGDFKALSLADFRFVFNPAQMRTIERLVEVLARRARRHFFRREKINNKHGRMELGRSLQRSIRYQGQVLKFRYRHKRRRLPRFVLILDVSQSMDVYAKLFLRFTRQLLTVFDHSEAFAFNTELIPLGSGYHQLTEKHFEATINSASKGWLGGTKIAVSLQTFNHNHLRASVDSRTTVLIFSDGCDTATPQALADEVALIQRRAKKLIWVNPLLGRFELGEQDMNMDPVRPYIDSYRSAHHLESLLSLQEELLG